MWSQLPYLARREGCMSVFLGRLCTCAWMWACFLRNWMNSRILWAFLTSDSLSWRNTTPLIRYKAEITTRENRPSSTTWSYSFKKGKGIKKNEVSRKEISTTRCIYAICFVKWKSIKRCRKIFAHQRAIWCFVWSRADFHILICLCGSSEIP